MRRFLFALPVLALLSSPVFAESTEVDRAVRAKLDDVRVDLDVQDGDFLGAVHRIREATGLNIMIDGRASTSAEDTTELSLNVSKMRASAALHWLVRSRDLEYTIVDGVVLITSQEGAAGPVELRLYDVADILSQPRDFPADGASETSEVTADDLVNLITSTVTPGVWDSEGRSIQVAGTTLVVAADHSALGQLERLLGALRVMAHFTVTFDARVIDITPAALAGIPGTGTLAPGKILLSAEEAAGLLGRSNDDTRVLETARFTCMNGQRTHVKLGRESTDAMGVVSKDNGAGVLLEAHRHSERTVLEVSPILVVGRNQFFVNLNAFLVDAPEPATVLHLPSGSLSCARSSERAVRTSFQCPNGGAALFVLGAAPGDRVRALLVRISSTAPHFTSTPLQPVSPEEDAATKVYHDFLAKKVTLDFAAKPFADVVAQLAAFGGLNVLIDPRLRHEESVSEWQVTIKLKEVEMKTALGLISQMYGITTVFRDEAVVFTSAHNAEQGRVELYDVRDLIWRRMDWPAPEPERDSSGQVVAALEISEGNPAFNQDQLLELIRQNIAPDSWGNGSASIAFFNGALVVLQNATAHQNLLGFLSRLREAKPLQIQIDARIVEIDPAIHDALDAGGDGPLPEASIQKLEKAIAGGKAHVRTAWSIVGMNAQRFHALETSRRTYVDSYDKCDTVPDPVFHQVAATHLLEIRPTLVSSDPGGLVVDLRIASRDFPTDFANADLGQTVIQLPSASDGGLSTTVATRSGETRMFSLGNVQDGEKVRRRVVIWTVKVVE